MIISTPKVVSKQMNVFGNDYEIHKFQWKKKHFSNFSNKFFIPNYNSIICYIGEDYYKVRKNFFILKIKSYFPFLRIPVMIFKKIK